jgi:tetratricopeptide (TPR) repeat protein
MNLSPCLILIYLVISLVGCSSTAPNWPSLPFQPDSPEADTDDHRKAAAAYQRLLEDPSSEEQIIWYGRRVGYLGDYILAIEIYSRGLQIHPNSPRLLRHRGHRYISLRQFDRAITDFERAVELIDGQPDEIEPDGMPNAQNIPTSTLHGNIWYHLGLAHYCRGEFGKALASYQRCLDGAKNLDSEVATRYWIYLTATRLDRSATAQTALEPVRPNWEIIENNTYHDLLLLYRGDLAFKEVARDSGDALEDATLGYGLARYDLIHGAEKSGNDRLRKLAATGSSSFGCIAAEADLAR